jgi:hypothetical protein
MRSPRAIVWAVMLSTGLFTAAFAEGQAGPSSFGKRLSLEALYTLPRIIGTVPKAPAWSPDGRTVVFLWNEEGTNFYDVYVTAADDPKPVRLTSMPHRTLSGEPAGSPDAVAEAESIELDPGVTAVRWHPDGKRLVFSFRQASYILVPGREPEKMTEAAGLEPMAVVSPDGKLQAFLRVGVLAVKPVGDPGAPARELLKPAAGIRLRVNAWSPDGRRILVTEIDGRKMPRRKVPDYLPAETEVREVPRAFPGEETSTQRIGIVDVASTEVRWLDLGDRTAGRSSSTLATSSSRTVGSRSSRRRPARSGNGSGSAIRSTSRPAGRPAGPRMGTGSISCRTGRRTITSGSSLRPGPRRFASPRARGPCSRSRSRRRPRRSTSSRTQVGPKSVISSGSA